MKAFLTFALLLFIFINPFISLAQNGDIEITDLVIENNQLAIYYNITKAKKKQTFEVWPVITTSNGQKINASNFSGDFGENIEPGLDKKIIWDYNADGIILNDKIFVELQARVAVTSTDIGLGNALLLSAVIPGLGITKAKGGGPYWLMSIPVYASTALAFTNYNDAKNSYDAYLNGNFAAPEDASLQYNNAIDSQNMSRTFTYSAIGIWAVNMIWTGLSARKKKTGTAYKYYKKTLFYSRINPVNKTLGFTLKYNF